MCGIRLVMLSCVVST